MFCSNYWYAFVSCDLELPLSLVTMKAAQLRMCVFSMVASSAISGKFLQKISVNLFKSFRKFVNYLCQSAISKSSIAKRCCKINNF